jgi:starch phosphorylase
MYLYNQIKEHPEREYVPRTFIFGAKASAGYHIAKLIIKLINNVGEVINNDPTIDGKIKVVFIEDYRVSNAEKIFAAANVSEQISTASKEASGTSNMKFMLNGAITIGTMDGATVEMVDEMGIDNAFIFGMSADEVIAHERDNDYNPMEIYNEDGDIRKVLEQLVNGFYSPENPELFRDIYNSLLNTLVTSRADIYFVLKDFRSYAQAQEKISELYQSPSEWAKMAILNMANVGKFSSDRTIQEYVDDIWGLDKIKVDYTK